MKKLTFLLALVFLSCLEGNAQNLILNPGFEICNGSNTGTCWAGTCIPNDRGQICIIPNWYAYINRNGYMLNNSIDFYTPDLFDKRADTNNCRVINGYNQYRFRNYHIPIVGIPNNFLTLGIDERNYQQLDSINTRNADNSRFAGLEANDTGFTNGIYKSVNKALVADLDPTYLPLTKNKIYKICFWAAAASYWTTAKGEDSPWNNDIIDVSLLKSSNGHEKEIVANRYVSSGDSSLFTNAIITHEFCPANPCRPPLTFPYGIWNYYEAVFCMDSTDYPDDYDQIVFKLNRYPYYHIYKDVPDVFIDDIKSSERPVNCQKYLIG